ncbi:MAG TPA: alpha-amylase family glycosyl hydrolase [Trebonia sp.]|nr:alpha-amylase family glycosyl hydrolase [Trebonia sp.]
MSQPWWHGAVIYQLYARSWRDAGGDGIGDLRGVIERLDHLSWLGVDGIWLSPTMPSPDADWGYDVSDYTGVHPELGTLADLDELITRAGRRGMRVLLDLVPNHTSSAHPWFVDAATGRDAPHRDYYVWADPAADGGPPNNWKDFTGRSAWQRHSSGQYYLHNYLPEQPDLNWWNPAVHREFRDILAFWFDRGVAGFRIDVAHGLYKDAQLRDNPPLTGDNSLLDGGFGLRPVYNANRPETHGVFRDWRKIAEDYFPTRLLLGETWVAEPERMASYYGQSDELQLAFNFPFAYAGFDAHLLADVVRRTLAALPAGACPVWMASNHDIGRFPSHWCGGDERKIRLALLVLATLPGTTVLYYGDEIGMADVDVPVSLRRDTATLNSGTDGNRDRARTPLPWDGTPGSGFTKPDVTPWLPVAQPPAGNVADQRADPGSILWLCRRLLALRRAQLGGGVADFEQLPAPEGQWVYRTGSLVVAANFSGRDADLPAAAGEVLLTTSGAALPGARGGLGPWQGIVARYSAAPGR